MREAKPDYRKYVEDLELHHLMPMIDEFYACEQVGHPLGVCQCLETATRMADWIVTTSI